MAQEKGNFHSEQATSETAGQEQQDEAVADVAERKATLDEDIDGILKDIDDVLEVNAEQFVKDFIQKGGQ